MNSFFGFLCSCIMLSSVAAYAGSVSDSERMKKEIEQDLVENILPFWTDKAVDDVNGGFYGVLRSDGTPVPEADKGAILNARILWTFSSAYRHYAYGDYKAMADRAADYYVSHFIDKKYGGVYWSVTSEGHPKNTVKQTYATAFGIYGLSEHFRATGNEKSLDAAISLYRTLEDKVHDKSGKGYIEVLGRDYSRNGAKGVDGNEGASKTMNTHIHVLEAYTNLYKVWPNPQLKANLVELLGILGNELYDKDTKHLRLFCDDNWKVLEEVVSYGHDIETSWLLCEAAEVTGDENIISATEKQAVEMVDAVLEMGFEDNWLMKPESEGKYKSYQWWPQNEAVIGLVNAWQITGASKYLDAASKCWDVASKYFIDNQHGGWHKIIRADFEPVKAAKASEWNCPYHNSRMGYEIKERLEKPRVHSEVMAWSNITGVRLEGELIDFESQLKVGNLNGEMESTGREKQRRIRYKRDGHTQTTITPMHGAIITQTVSDLDMSDVDLSWTVEATEDLKESAFFCMTFAPKYYKDAKITCSGKNISITAPERSIKLKFSKAVKTHVRAEDGNTAVYVTLSQKLEKGRKTTLSARMTVDGKRHHETAEINVDVTRPGREFAGFGGNFRIQNVRKDPTVIDYCLENMRIAYGRVEMPWSQWDEKGKESDHIRRSAEMAKKLKAKGMPVIVSCWFPPKWAGDQTTRSDGTARAFALKKDKMSEIYASLTSYLEFLKKDYGVEADYFSFNESDLGIDVVFTPEEHCTFIKEFGAYLAGKGLKTLLLLGDNSDATTFDFIVPALNDPDAHKYIGAVSFHSWRGCDDATLAKWAQASRQINVPLIVGEGSTDAAAHQYPGIFNETTFALYEINLYVRICAISQPLSILQWQLTSDYSILWGDGIYGSEGPLRPTQRYFNLKQLSMTPENAFAVPSVCGKENINVASFVKPSTGESAVHIVNNAASCDAEIKGLPVNSKEAVVYITDSRRKSEAMRLPVKDGCVRVWMPAESFVTILAR